MNEIFITSDAHFGHNKSFIYEARGFTSIEEHDEVLIERWNNTVTKDDIVYFLGDFALNDINNGIKCINSLNGRIYFIRGNHDSENKVRQIMDVCDNIYCVGWADVIKHGKIEFFLSHYPTMTTNYDEKHFNQHIVNLHGHSHQTCNFLYPNNPFIYHIGMDSHNCTPVNIEEVIYDVRQRWTDLQILKIPIDTISIPQSRKIDQDEKENKNE